jgi:polyphosphate glucokinase
MQAMGVDLGGSGFRLGVFDLTTGTLQGELVEHVHEGDLHPETVLSALAAAIETSGWSGAIGLGFPGAVSGNAALTAPNLGEEWVGYPVSAALQHLHNGRFAMLNDADAIAMAERLFGYGHDGFQRILTLTVGTGLGTTVHENGTMIPNLEYGRLPHPTRQGVLEAHLSGRARREEGLSLKAWSKRFQEGLNFLEGMLEPDLILVYGGIVEHWSTFSPHLSTRAVLQPARLRFTAGPLGAALSTLGLD